VRQIEKKPNKMRISNREIQVLELISKASSSNEIAEKLFISIETVKSHRKNLKYKLNARNSAETVRRGFELGFLKVHQDQHLGMRN
jgi:DNA-binding CsgD family transcriptional regulator